MIDKNNNFEFLEDSLLINNEILVLSDIHLGFEESVYEKLILDNLHTKEIKEKLERIFKVLEEKNIILKKIIILGDLKHDFGKIIDSEWRETLSLIDFLLSKVRSDKKNSEKLILIKGNHDTILFPILKKRALDLIDFYIEKDICFVHGDRFIKECKNCNTLILGHLHPSIMLKDDYKKEKFKCFLKGIYKNKRIIILPSFTESTIGFDLSEIAHENKDFSIIPNKTLKNFNVYVYDSKERKTLDFKKLKKFLSS